MTVPSDAFITTGQHAQAVARAWLCGLLASTAHIRDEVCTPCEAEYDDRRRSWVMFVCLPAGEIAGEIGVNA